MALNAFLKLSGQKQGAIKGASVQKGREGQIEVNAVDHQVNRSFDASGVPAAARQHQPFVITKDVDVSSPQLYQAMVGAEPMSEFTLQFFQTQAAGSELNYYTVTLAGAQIVGIKCEMPNNNYADLAALNVREKVAFTYTKITWTIVNGARSAQDTWGAAVAP